MLCAVCSTPSSKACSKCNVTYYCSTEHQLEDWSGGHKDCCVDYPHTADESRECEMMFAWYKNVMIRPQTTFEQKQIAILELFVMFQVAMELEHFKAHLSVRSALALRIIDVAIDMQLKKKMVLLMV